VARASRVGIAGLARFKGSTSGHLRVGRPRWGVRRRSGGCGCRWPAAAGCKRSAISGHAPWGTHRSIRI